MKENLRNEEGITLIALVITIIVLLILAIVTIRIVVNQNIIGHANNAVTAYNEAQNNESEQLTWAEEMMKNKGGTSNSNGSVETEKSNLILTEEEKVAIAEKGGLKNGQYIVALNDNTEKAVAMSDEIINIVVGETSYAMFINDSPLLEQYHAEKNKWYIVEGGSPSIYEGTCPISKSNDFLTEGAIIYSEEYLDRIIASF